MLTSTSTQISSHCEKIPPPRGYWKPPRRDKKRPTSHFLTKSAHCMLLKSSFMRPMPESWPCSAASANMPQIRIRNHTATVCASQHFIRRTYTDSRTMISPYVEVLQYLSRPYQPYRGLSIFGDRFWRRLSLRRNRRTGKRKPLELVQKLFWGGNNVITRMNLKWSCISCCELAIVYIERKWRFSIEFQMSLDEQMPADSWKRIIRWQKSQSVIIFRETG